MSVGTSSAMSTSNQYIKYTINIKQNHRNVSDNTSSVTVSVRFYRTNTGYTSYGTGTVYCVIDGKKYSAAVTPSQKITSSGIVLFSKTLNVKHADNGTKTLTCSAWISHNVVTSSEQKYSLALDSIARASSISSFTGSTAIGSTITVNIDRKSSTFVHGVWYKVGNSSWQTVASTGVTTSKAFTINMSMCNQITNATSGTMTVMIKTYRSSTDNTQIGASATKTVTVTVPSSVSPKCTASISDATSYYSKFGSYVQGLSKIKMTISGTPSYESPITSYSATIGGVTYSGSSITSNVINTSGTLPILYSVKDARGRGGALSTSVNVLPYAYPRITKFTVGRCNSDGSDNDGGAYVKVIYSYVISALNNKNGVSGSIKYKKTGTSTYATVNLSLAAGSYTGTDKTYVFAADTGSPFDISLAIGDSVRTIEKNTSVSTAFTLMHFNASGRGMGIGRVSNKDTLQVELPAEFKSANVESLSAGPNTKITSNAATSWLECAKGAASIVMTATAADCKPVFSGKTTNGVMGISIYQNALWAWYMNNTNINAGTNSLTKSARLIDENGNMFTEGDVFAKTFFKSGTREVACLDNIPRCKQLWSGGYYMSEGHVATLSESVQSQHHGIILVFSPYSNGAVANNNWQNFFVSKTFINDHQGQTHTFTLYGDLLAKPGSKYLGINNTQIKGHANNTKTGTSATSGVKYQNNFWVLRYVYGI